MFCPAAAPHTAKLPKAGPMLLTQCAVCAADLGLTLGKKCGRCSTRYCGPECQVQHWKEGGHDKLCKTIKKAGGAEQYNANKKYSEAISVAAEACAEDTKGQTCYICTQALHWKTKEGLVRGCACRGTAGFVHLSCLAEQAKILVAEGLENNLAFDERWARWDKCGLCEQEYHGAVCGALGWACWKTYLGRPEGNKLRRASMQVLGQSLYCDDQAKDALAVFEAELNTERRLTDFDSDDDDALSLQCNIADCYAKLERYGDAYFLRRKMYEKRLKKYGPMNAEVIADGLNVALSLVKDYYFEEAKPFLRDLIPKAESVHGRKHSATLHLRQLYAEAIYKHCDSNLDEQREGIATLQDVHRIARQVFGSSHPNCKVAEEALANARARLLAQARLVEDASEKLAQGLRIDGDDESDAP